MKEYDAIYVGNGKIEAFRDVKEGEHLEIFVPNDLMEDFNKHAGKLLIRTVTYKRPQS